MQDIIEQLSYLEPDGRLYAHFLTNPATPGYYAVWVRERTPQYIELWLQQSAYPAYRLALSIEMTDTAFTDYMNEIYPDQIEVKGLKKLYLIDNLNLELANHMCHNFRNWKQEKIRLHRAKWLEQFPWVVSTQLG